MLATAHYYHSMGSHAMCVCVLEYVWAGVLECVSKHVNRWRRHSNMVKLLGSPWERMFLPLITCMGELIETPFSVT